VRLQLHALAYDLANFMRTLALPEEVEHWSLTTLREKLVKIGARIVRDGRYVVFQLGRGDGAAGAVRRHLAPDRSPAATVAAAPGKRIGSDERRRPSKRGASMIDRKPIQRSDNSGRKPHIRSRLGGASRAGPGRRSLASRGERAHDWPSETGKLGIPVKSFRIPTRQRADVGAGCHVPYHIELNSRLNTRAIAAKAIPLETDMGSINFSAASMFGTLSDVVGTKSGLALNRRQLAELLGRDERFQEFQALGDDDWVRIHSSTAEEMIEFLLFSVGRLERINNPFLIERLLHKYKKKPAKLTIVYAISEEFIDFLNETLANPDLKRGDRIDPSPFMLKCLKKHGRLGFEISNDLIINYAIQLEIKSWHVPTISEWTDIAELNDLFFSEGLASQCGQFFDQRYIDYLHRNFDDIDRINWRKFEGLTAEYFDRQGFRVDVGPGRNDDGIDVRVWPSTDSLDSPPAIIVQCKRQKQSIEKVIVKSLYADVVHAEAKSGLIVTTSRLSPGAKAVCSVRQYPIVEADRATVRTWVAEMRKPGMGIAT
jgi:restriction system protein